MSRSALSPLTHVHAEVLAAEQGSRPLAAAGAPYAAASVEDWRDALRLADVVVHMEEEEGGHVPPDPTFADTEAALVDASATEVASARIF